MIYRLQRKFILISAVSVLIARLDEALEKLLTEEQKAIFEKYQDCWNEYVSLAEAAIFEYAFKLGMQIAIETLTE